MLHLIPAPLHRAGLRLAHWGRKRWWRLARPRLDGVLLVAQNEHGHVLLVRHTYGRGLWTLPGGGRRRSEAPEAAAAREFAEELGCALAGLAFAGMHESELHGARLRRHVFAGVPAGEIRPDRREIAEAGFFPPDALPGECSPMLATYLAMAAGRHSSSE